MTATLPDVGLPAPRRFAPVYACLVVVPLLVAAALLWHAGTGPPLTGRTDPAQVAVVPVARLLLAAGVMIATCLAAGALARKAGQPAVVGEIAGGVLLGPSVLGLLWPQGAAWLLPAGVVGPLGALAQFGVLFFVFLAGLEVDVAALRGRGRMSVVVSHVGIAVPLLSGVVLALACYSTFAPDGVAPAPFALFIGVAMSVTALPVLARILEEAGLLRSPLAALALTSAVVDDVTAWCLLGVAVALLGASTAWAVVLVPVAVVVAGPVVFVAVRSLLRRAGDRVPWWAVPAVVVAVLLVAAGAESAGVPALCAAFLLGLAVPGDSRLSREARDRLGGVTTVLLPLFFAVSGLHTDLGRVAESWGWCAVVLAVAVAGKFGGVAAAARLIGLRAGEAVRLGALMNCRGMTELVVLDLGRRLGVIGPDLFSVLVVTALVSTAMTGPFLRSTTTERRLPP
ncbi:cation:proton antiporter [Umezawaea sp.]|uniref:cation:proton antiporter n=1 Tax=Umezawaea sp. TaxID=1955258 RepID=UPI002ED2347B